MTCSATELRSLFLNQYAAEHPAWINIGVDGEAPGVGLFHRGRR